MRTLLTLAAGFSLLLAASAQAGKGVFDVGAPYSHTLHDDPIVFPGQPGASHEHDFFCNTLTDAFATGHSLLAAGETNPNVTLCVEGAGIGKHNFSGYWTPAVYINGVKIVPDHVHVYYRDAARNGDIESFPTDFRMVIPFVKYFCDGPGHGSKTGLPADCLGDKGFKAAVVTPPCWDGRLDSEDHRSHVTYMQDADRCPTSHPRKLPRLTMHFTFPVERQLGRPIGFADTPLLGGPGYDMPPETFHADVLSAWRPERLQLLIDECLLAQIDCKRNPPRDQ